MADTKQIVLFWSRNMRLFVIFVLLLSGCGNKQEKIPVTYLPSQIDLSKEPKNDFWVSKIDYDGHEYVVLEGEYGLALAHKANCGCQKKK
jgi:hypothetical protein